MRFLAPILLVALFVVSGLVSGGRAAEGDGQAASAPSTAPAEAGGPSRFSAVHVYVDSGDKPLAAYQFELTAKSGSAKLVGLEGGDHAAFRQPPYYDPRALLNDKVIVAAFSTAADLPKNKTRVATLMVRVAGQGEPTYDARLTAAATADGGRIDARLTVAPAATIDRPTTGPADAADHAISSPATSTSPTPISEGAVR
jgi:hypothetical protein